MTLGLNVGPETGFPLMPGLLLGLETGLVVWLRPPIAFAAGCVLWLLEWVGGVACGLASDSVVVVVVVGAVAVMSELRETVGTLCCLSGSMGGLGLSLPAASPAGPL